MAETVTSSPEYPSWVTPPMVYGVPYSFDVAGKITYHTPLGNQVDGVDNNAEPVRVDMEEPSPNASPAALVDEIPMFIDSITQSDPRPLGEGQPDKGQPGEEQHGQKQHGKEKHGRGQHGEEQHSEKHSSEKRHGETGPGDAGMPSDKADVGLFGVTVLESGGNVLDDIPADLQAFREAEVLMGLVDAGADEEADDVGVDAGVSSDKADGGLFEVPVFESGGDALDDVTPDLQVFREAGVLMGLVDAGADEKTYDVGVDAGAMSDKADGVLLKVPVLKGGGDALDDVTADLQVFREAGILMGLVDAGAGEEVDDLGVVAAAPPYKADVGLLEVPVLDGGGDAFDGVSADLQVFRETRVLMGLVDAGADEEADDAGVYAGALSDKSDGGLLEVPVLLSGGNAFDDVSADLQAFREAEVLMSLVDTGADEEVAGVPSYKADGGLLEVPVLLSGGDAFDDVSADLQVFREAGVLMGLVYAKGS